MSTDSFGAQSRLDVGPASFEIFRLDALDAIADVHRLPFSVKVLLENLLRHEDGATVTQADVEALARWAPELGGHTGDRLRRRPACSCRTSPVCPPSSTWPRCATPWRRFGADPATIDPRVPVELIVDHSVIADVIGSLGRVSSATPSSSSTRNRERYELLRWAQDAFANVRVMPPGSGICHQVNLEYLARVVFVDADGRAYPDTLVGTDSHTPMVNGLGVLGWGVGGIEAEAAMLGEPLSLLLPAVVGVRLAGELPEGVDCHRPRAHHRRAAAPARCGRQVRGVLRAGRGRGAAGEPGDHRQHVARVRLDLRDVPDRRRDPSLPPVHRPPTRADRAGRGLRQGARACSTSRARPTRSSPRPSSFDLATVEPSIAGPVPPARPRAARRRPPVVPARAGRRARRRATVRSRRAARTRPRAQSFPASDPPASNAGRSNRPAASAASTRSAGAGARSMPERRAAPPPPSSPTAPRSRSTTATSSSPPSPAAPTRPTRRSWSPPGCSRKEGGRARAEHQAVGQDVPRPRLAGRHRLPGRRRPGGPTRGARVPPRRATGAPPASATRVPLLDGVSDAVARVRPGGLRRARRGTGTSRAASTPTSA